MGKPNISRTYEKKSATAVVNSLFARNITKRKTEKIKQKKVKRTVQKICISDLPPVDHNHHLLNDSFKNDSPITDLFDQIKRTEVYNPVNLKPTVHYFSSDSEVSKNYKTDSIPLISIINPTPVKREKRPRKITTKRKNKEFIKHSKHCVHNRNSSTKEQKTLDKSVNVELSIENELQKNIEYNTLNITCSKLSADNDVLGPFIELARPQKEQFVDDTIYVTSTPLETYRRKIDYSCLSPILAKSKRFTSQSVGLSSIDCLVEKSLDEIRKWDYVVPDFSYSVPKNNSTTKGMMFGNSRKSFISANNSLKSVLEVPRRRKTIDYSSLNSTSLLKPVTKKNRRTSCIGFNANGDRLSNCCKEKPIRLKECCVKLKYCVELEKRIDWKLNCSPFVKLDYLIDILGINTSISWSNLKDSTNENSTNSSINLRINKRNVKIKNKRKKYRKGRLPLKVLKNIKKKKKTSKKNIFKSSFRYEEDKPYHLPQNKDVISNNLGLLKRSLTKKYNKLLDKLPSNIHKKFIKQPHVALMRNRELEYCLVNRKTRNSSRRPTLFLSKDASTKRSKNKNIYSDICSLDKEISVIVDDIVNTSQNCPTNFITLRRKLKGNNDIIGDLVKTPLSTSRQTKCNEKMYNSNGLLNKRITGIDLRRSVSLKTFDVDNCSDNETDQSHYPVNIVKSDCTSKPKEPLHISKKLNNDIAKLLQSPLSDYVKSKCLNNLNASVKYNSSSDLFDSKSDLDLSECTSPDSATEKYLLNNSSLNVHITQDKMVKKCFKSQNSTISQTEYVDLPSTCSTVKDLVDMSTQTDDLFCISDCVYVPFVKPRSIEKTQNSSAIVENMEDVDFVIEISHNSASNELKNIENTIALKQLNRDDPLFVENCIEKLREYVVNPISNSSLITQKGNVTHRSKEKKIVENVIDLNNSCSGNVNDDLNRIENIIATKDVSKCDSLRAENCVEEPKEFVVDPASNSSFITQQGKITHRSKEKKIVEKVIDLNNSCSDNENNDFSCTENITASKEVNKDDFFHVENCIEEPKKSIVEPVRNNTQQDKICRRSKEKRTMENVIDLNNSCNINENDDFVMPIQSLKPQTFTVKTGKSYKRSLSCLRRSSSQLLGSTVALRDGGSSCSLISNISDSRRRLSKVSLSQGFKGFPKSGDTLLQTFAVAFTGKINTCGLFCCRGI
ncbi:uncharacterized protein LOC108740899 [Agrilus planipennis]|uniref:Uncharacterized protein LOC108740899 n=1 Tax=Agrilus planipennis TaxID=224129 RepID=A0A1W4XF05_AGRPL|nr:uncharacterized protein LOC108740899 [Agrilus planipennis]XP_018330925.1 uncharacterized protein LOC108740899 [Agrilus planipennis]XP_018330930.1 uncharacterized protein LOC108740899 [Agrilus planipennis]